MRPQSLPQRQRRGAAFKKDSNFLQIGKKASSKTHLEEKREDYLLESIKQLRYASDHSHGVQLEIDHLMALVLNTFIWSSWFKNLELSGGDDLSLEIKNTIDSVVGDMVMKCRTIGDDWVLILLRDIINVVVQWINNDGNDIPFQLRVDSNRLINREQAYSRITIGKIVDGSMGLGCKSRIQRDFVIGVLDGVVMKSIIEGYSDNFAIWGIIDKISKKMLDTETTKLTPRKKTKSMFELISFKSKYKPLSYNDLVPLLKLICQLTEVYEYPILWIMITMTLQMVLSVPLLNNLLTNLVYGMINRTVNERSISSGVQRLEKVLYPMEESPTKWGLKPRWEPSNAEELEQLRTRCITQVGEVISKVQNGRFGWVLFDGATPSEKIARVLVDKFASKVANKILLWDLIENVVSHVLRERVLRV